MTYSNHLICHYKDYLGKNVKENDKCGYNKFYDSILPAILKTTSTHDYTIYGKTITTKRRSCVYTDHKTELQNIGYKKTPLYFWSEAPIEIINLREKIEHEFKVQIDYVLVHIYRDRNDKIGWHNDSEALNSDIFSFSLGISRSFEIRPYSDTKGVEKTYWLEAGDLVHMKTGCQQKYKHRAPPMKIKELRNLVEEKIQLPKGRITYKVLDKLIEDYNIDTKRINMTFRKLDKCV